MMRVRQVSLRLRLVVGSSAAILLVLVLLGFAIYLSVRHDLVSDLESELRGKANALASMTEIGRHGARLDADLQKMPEFFDVHRPQYFELWQADGYVITRSASLGANDLPKIGDSSKIQLPGGRSGWAVSKTFVPHIDVEEEEDENASTTMPVTGAVTVCVARDLSEVHYGLEQLRNLLIGLCAGAVAASGVALWLVVHFAMRPVVHLSDQIAAVNEHGLSNEISQGALPVELRPIVRRLNELLRRLSAAFEREKAFTADIAHELRTPLSALLTTLDVCRSRQRSSQEYEAALDKFRDLTRRLKSMVQNLLTMVRAEAGNLANQVEPVDFCQFAKECWIPFGEKATQRGFTVEWHQSAESCLITADREKLLIVLTNLMDNALSYTNTGGSIVLSITAPGDGSAIFQIANTGNGIAPPDMLRVFERFWRGDSSRSQGDMHCGLGLSLCQRLAKVMGLDVQAQARPPDWFVIRLIFPT